MRIVGTIYFTSFVSSAQNADVNDTACDHAIRVAGVNASLIRWISLPTLPTTNNTARRNGRRTFPHRVGGRFVPFLSQT